MFTCESSTARNNRKSELSPPNRRGLSLLALRAPAEERMWSQSDVSVLRDKEGTVLLFTTTFANDTCIGATTWRCTPLQQTAVCVSTEGPGWVAAVCSLSLNTKNITALALIQSHTSVSPQYSHQSFHSLCLLTVSLIKACLHLDKKYFEHFNLEIVFFLFLLFRIFFGHNHENQFFTFST